MNNSTAIPTKPNRWYAYIILFIPVGIMIYNLHAMPYENIYDLRSHLAYMKSIFSHDSATNLHMSIYSSLYYYIGATFLNIFNMSDQQTITALKALNIISYYIFSVVLMQIYFKFYRKDIYYDIIFAINLGVIPNLYLFNSMVRPEDLFFILISIFILLYIKKFNWTNILIMSAASALIALSKHNGLCLLPILMISISLKLSTNKVPIKTIFAILALLTLCSTSFYINKIYQNDTLMPRTNYAFKYKERENNLNRLAMFTNLEFLTLYQTPNRNAVFSNGNNSVFPRLYGDMWGDHWLYFSGEKQVENKAMFKRIAFIAGIPFTLMLLWAVFRGAILFMASVARRQLPTPSELAAALAASSFFFLMLTVYVMPIPGKNSIVKFAYLMPTALLFVFPLQDIVLKFPLRRLYAAYTILLFLACLPLYIYK